jgi:hypothetical protein
MYFSQPSFSIFEWCDTWLTSPAPQVSLHTLAPLKHEYIILVVARLARGDYDYIALDALNAMHVM